jgi:hypothetical protein
MTVYVSTKDEKPLELFETLEACKESIRTLKKKKGYWEFDNREAAEKALNEEQFICTVASPNMYTVLGEVYT